MYAPKVGFFLFIKVWYNKTCLQRNFDITKKIYSIYSLGRCRSMLQNHCSNSSEKKTATVQPNATIPQRQTNKSLFIKETTRLNKNSKDDLNVSQINNISQIT